MMYTSETKVREISGLDDAENIPSSVVKHKISVAGSMVDGAIVRKYLLPLSFHRKNTLTFSGEGTGIGVLTVIINGSNYDVSISEGLTAGQAADLFLEAAYGNSDFIVDLDGEESVVTIISLADSKNQPQGNPEANAQVNVSNAGGTVEGITCTAGVRADRYPPMVDQVTAEIASSLLLMDSYGVEAEDTAKDGDKRMDRINKVLLQIQGKDDNIPDFKLIDEVSKQELTTSGNTPAFSPSDSEPSVRMDKVF